MTAEANSVENEFAIVRQLLISSSKSRCVDAFALALLKTERQTRRLFTYLAFQSSCFSRNDAVPMRKVLSTHPSFGFASALAGFDVLSPISMADLFGQRYPELMAALAQIKSVRNKLFHGQVTTEGRSRQELEDLIGYLIEWATSLAASSQLQLGYDGFTFVSSYTKHDDLQFHSTLKRKLTNIKDYGMLIKEAHALGKNLFCVPGTNSH